MKRLLLTTIVLMALPFGLVNAQDITSAAFAGCQYDSDLGWAATYGTGARVTTGLWTVGRLTAGSFDAAELDLIAVKKFGNFLAGVVAGPNVDWSGDQDMLAYIVGGCGGLVGWQNNPLGIGIVAGAKFKFSFDGGDFYKDGWQTGLWLTKGL